MSQDQNWNFRVAVADKVNNFFNRHTGWYMKEHHYRFQPFPDQYICAFRKIELEQIENSADPDGEKEWLMLEKAGLWGFIESLTHDECLRRKKLYYDRQDAERRAATASVRAAIEREKAERAAALAVIEDERLHGADRLRTLIDENPWSETKHCARLIRAGATADDSVVRQRLRERRAIEAKVAKADERIATLSAGAAVVDGTVAQTAVLDALREMCALDLDRARKRNGVGWSRSDSPLGHRLSRRSALSAAEVVVAMTLLRRHARQIPDTRRSELGV